MLGMLTYWRAHWQEFVEQETLEGDRGSPNLYGPEEAGIRSETLSFLLLTNDWTDMQRTCNNSDNYQQ